MAWYFCDTSALARRYIRSEPAARRVVEICRAASGHVVAVARITPVEIASTFARYRRDGALDEATSRRYWRLFQRHFRDQYEIVEVDHRIIEDASALLFRHPLRAYDAVQLACALEVRVAAGLAADFRFCTADRRQAAAAADEGLAVELIG